MGTHLPSPEKGAQPLQFSAHVCCAQMAEWIEMPFGMEVGLGSGHIVQDGDPAPHSQKGGTGPQFSACVCCG